MACQCLAIIFTYSNGAIISMAIGVICLIPLSIWKAQDRITIILSIVVLFLIIGCVVIYFYKYKNEEINTLFYRLYTINFEDFNGRKDIY